MLTLVRSASFRVSLAVFASLLAAVVGGTIVLHDHDLVISSVDLHARPGG